MRSGQRMCGKGWLLGGSVCVALLMASQTLAADLPAQFPPSAERQAKPLRPATTKTKITFRASEFQPAVVSVSQTMPPVADGSADIYDDINASIPPIRLLKASARVASEGDTPDDYGQEWVKTHGSVGYHSRPFHDSLRYSSQDSAADFCYGALYFEERKLERYGHHIGVLQPLASAAHFFGSTPLLPYQMGKYSPLHCYYWEHPFQAGREAPPFRYERRLSFPGTLVEVGLAAGLIIALP